MATSRSATRKSEVETWLPAERLSEILGIALMAVALMVVTSLLSALAERSRVVLQGNDAARDGESHRSGWRVPVRSVSSGVRARILRLGRAFVLRGLEPVLVPAD